MHRNVAVTVVIVLACVLLGFASISVDFFGLFGKSSPDKHSQHSLHSPHAQLALQPSEFCARLQANDLMTDENGSGKPAL